MAIHALVAHHQDVHLRQDLCTVDQLNAASFHCPVENLVVAFPFLVSSITVPLHAAQVFVAHNASVLAAPLSAAHPLYGLRGPPVTV